MMRGTIEHRNGKSVDTVFDQELRTRMQIIEGGPGEEWKERHRRLFQSSDHLSHNVGNVCVVALEIALRRRSSDR